MFDIAPRHPWLFDGLLNAKRMSAFIAPPFDAITPDLQSQMAAADVHAGHLEMDVTTPSSKEASNRGTLAQAWKDQGTIKQHADKAAILLMDRFKSTSGETKQRTTLLTLLRMPIDAPNLWPHERTMEGPIQGRLALYNAENVFPSPIFLLADDPDKTFYQALQVKERGFDPDATTTIQNPYDQDLQHSIQPLDQDTLKHLVQAFSQSHLLVADGHHRLEAAKRWAREKQLTYFDIFVAVGSMTDPGIFVQGMSRLLVTPHPDTIAQALPQHFEILPFDGTFESFKRSGAAMAWTRKDVEGSSSGYLLTPKHSAKDAVASAAVDQFIQGALGIDAESVTYKPNGLWTNDVHSGFWIKPPDLDQILACAKSGQTMPKKTTCFHPKIMTGFAFYDLT